MRTSWSAWFGLTVALLIVAAGISPESAVQKPVKRHPLHLDGGIQPATIAELWAASPLVVDVIVTGHRPDNAHVLTIGGPEPARLAKTIVECQVLAVLKSDGQVTADIKTVEVRRIGGRIERAKHIDEYYDELFPPLKKNERYVLFLRAGSADTPYWAVTNDGGSAFELQGERVIPYGRSPLSLSLGKLSPAQFLQLIKEQKGGR